MGFFCAIYTNKRGVLKMDFLGILVEGNILATFVNMFTVVFALDFILGFVYILRGMIK